jgi:CDP-diacylglycerol---glycerol-3-phosphate 3-phosphatidyltransferase
MTATQPSVAGRSFRDRARAAVEPLARVLGRLGLTPNALTLIGFGIAVVAAAAAAMQWWLAAGLLVAFGAVFDLFDGALARATNTTSRLGAFMDSVFDRAGEAVVYVGLVAGLAAAGQAGGVPAGAFLGPLAAAAAMGAAFMVSYTRAKSENMGFTAGSGMAAVGFAPREVRVVILALGLIGAAVVPTGDFPLGSGPPAPYWWLLLVGSLALIAILATITTIQRILHVVREAEKQEK